MGQPFAAINVLTIANDGRSATVHGDSTIGPQVSSSDLLRFSPEGTALARCTFTSGAAAGASYDVHYVLTDHQRAIKLWISNPALHATSDLRRP